MSCFLNIITKAKLPVISVITSSPRPSARFCRYFIVVFYDIYNEKLMTKKYSID